MVYHRPLEGTPKTCTLRRSSLGKWYVTITCEVDAQPLPATGEAVGIDVGLLSFATLSTGEHTPCPKFLRTDEKDLKRTQRKLSAATKGTPERRKRRKIVSRVHERIRNRRSNFAHQESRRVVNRFDVIAVEDLSVNQMVHNHCLAKSIHDAAWSQFATFLLVQGSMCWSSVCSGQPGVHEPGLFWLWASPEEDAGRACTLLSVLWVDTRPRP